MSSKDEGNKSPHQQSLSSTTQMTGLIPPNNSISTSHAGMGGGNGPQMNNVPSSEALSDQLNKVALYNLFTGAGESKVEDVFEDLDVNCSGTVTWRTIASLLAPADMHHQTRFPLDHKLSVEEFQTFVEHVASQYKAKQAQ